MKAHSRTAVRSDPLVIVTAADETYAMPLCVTLYSALRSYGGRRAVIIFVLDGGVTAAAKSRLERVVRGFGAEVTWLVPAPELLAGMKISGHISIAAYYRLLIPDLLPSLCTRALYLDSDLVVVDDLDSLWDLDVSDVPLLAKVDGLVSAPWALLNYAQLGLRPDAKYFNSGVMLLNLALWRREGISARVLRYLHEHAEYVRWWDQDALNAVLAGWWRELDAAWNVPAALIDAPGAEGDSPSIVHFNSRNKPWSRYAQPRSRALFERYLRESRWYSAAGWAAYKARTRLARSVYWVYQRVVSQAGVAKRLRRRNSRRAGRRGVS